MNIDRDSRACWANYGSLSILPLALALWASSSRVDRDVWTMIKATSERSVRLVVKIIWSL